MVNKFLISALCSSTLFLTACGGGEDTNQDSFQNKEKVDYTKPETIESIYEPIINLSTEQDNIALMGTQFAESIFYYIQAGSTFSCASGSYTKNKDNSITFNQCTSPAPRDADGNVLTDVGVFSISGTVNSQEIGSTNTGRYDTTLKSFKISPSNDITLTYDGNIISEYSYTSAKYQIQKMTLNVFDAEIQRTEQLTINNYRLYLTNLSANAQGNIEGNPDNKFFSVNFNSTLRFGSNADQEAFYPSFAEIVIEDTNNPKNAITISRTGNYKALIRAYANGNTVTGFPKVVDWNELN